MQREPSLTVEHAASILRLSPAAVERLLDSGQLVRADSLKKRARVQANSLRALEDIMCGDDDSTDIEQLRINAARACVKADINESRVDMICDVLGLHPSEVPTDRVSVIRTFRAVGAEILIEGVCPGVDYIRKWSRFVGSLTPSYFTLVTAYTENRHPWKPFVRFFEHVHETAPTPHQLSTMAPDVMIAHAHANAARRHLTQITYIHLVERDGAEAAARTVPVPEKLGDRLFQHMMGMRPDAVRTAYGPTNTEGVQRQRPTAQSRTERTTANTLRIRQEAQDMLRDLDADDAEDMNFPGITPT